MTREELLKTRLIMEFNKGTIFNYLIHIISYDYAYDNRYRNRYKRFR